MQIGEELCRRLLQDQYQYVIATHIDHDHIHNHIIFNNINMFSGYTFETEHNQGKKPVRAWKELQKLSDNICCENGLSVIKKPKGKGVSHYEREIQKAGISWKEKLRDIIGELVLQSKNIDDFLLRCSANGIEYVYKPNNKVSLKFRMKGQQRFTRGDTLSEYYTAEKLADFIEFNQKMIAQKQAVSKPVEVPKSQPTPSITPPKTEPTAAPKPTITEVPKPHPAPSIITPPKTEPTDRVVITAEEFLSGTSPQDKPITTAKPIEKPSEKKEIKADPWEKFRAYGYGDEDIKKLKKVGIKSYDQLHNMMYRSGEDLGDTLNHLWDDVMHLDTLVRYMQTRDRLQPVKTASDSKTGWLKSHYDKKHHDELYDYGAAVVYIRDHIDEYKDENGKKPTLKALQSKLKAMKNELDQLETAHNAHQAQYSLAHPYIKRIRTLQMKEQNRRAVEQSREKTQTKKKTYLE